MYFLEVYFNYTLIYKYTLQKFMGSCQGLFVSVDHFMDRVQLCEGCRVTVRTYYLNTKCPGIIDTH